jgi:hypothetical protein
MRGKKLYNELLQPGGPDQAQKGRKDELLEDRNKCLVARYYYYGHLKARSYEDILLLLVREFFLSPDRINRIVLNYAETIAEMKQQKVSLYRLSVLWPHLCWRR